MILSTFRPSNDNLWQTVSLPQLTPEDSVSRGPTVSGAVAHNGLLARLGRGPRLDGPCIRQQLNQLQWIHTRAFDR